MLICGLDIETTGLEPGDHKIIEVYAGLWDPATGALAAEFQQRINPERSIQAEAQRVHGISLSDLVSEPVWSAVAPDLVRFLEQGEVFVAHNGDGFDIPFINYELARVALPRLTKPTVDTMLQGRWATPVGKIPNLGELAWSCEVEYDPAKAHAAHYDVHVMMECFFRGLQWRFFQLPETTVSTELLVAA